MADVVVLGGGLIGLTSTLLLARDGHRVTVIERDPDGPPASSDEAWQHWTRRGVNQFRQLHFMAPACHEILAAELPDLVADLLAHGALRMNAISDAPAEVTGGHRVGDERFDQVTGRRPMLEASFARVAEAEPAVTIRRGAGVAALLVAEEPVAGRRVAGVVIEDGSQVPADVVIDATGRRSPTPALLADAGWSLPEEAKEDLGFVYYGRHFRSADGSVPPSLGPVLMDGATLSVLTLPADNGTWGIGVVASCRDERARRLRDVETWTRVVKAFPLAAHWLDGDPLDESVLVMAKLEDRYRRFVVDGEPVAPGLLAVGDSWACTNPSLGRGIAIGIRHARALRDLLRDAPADDPRSLSLRWHEETEQALRPWYEVTNQYDRNRLAAVDAALGVTASPTDESWELNRALFSAAFADPDVLRALQTIYGVLDLPDVALGAPGMVDKVMALGGGWRDDPPVGPSATEAMNLLGA